MYLVLSNYCYHAGSVIEKLTISGCRRGPDTAGRTIFYVFILSYIIL